MLAGEGTAVVKSSTVVGIIAIIFGGMLVMGALMFLLVAAMQNLRGAIVITALVQVILGFLAAVCGWLLLRGYAAAKFILVAVAAGVVVNGVVYTILLLSLPHG
jgi:hypothetical protein